MQSSPVTTPNTDKHLHQLIPPFSPPPTPPPLPKKLKKPNNFDNNYYVPKNIVVGDVVDIDDHDKNYIKTIDSKDHYYHYQSIKNFKPAANGKTKDLSATTNFYHSHHYPYHHSKKHQQQQQQQQALHKPQHQKLNNTNDSLGIAVGKKMNSSIVVNQPVYHSLKHNSNNSHHKKHKNHSSQSHSSQSSNRQYNTNTSTSSCYYTSSSNSNDSIKYETRSNYY